MTEFSFFTLNNKFVLVMDINVNGWFSPGIIDLLGSSRTETASYFIGKQSLYSLTG